MTGGEESFASSESSTSLGHHEPHEVFQVEQRGIGLIPDSDRTGKPVGLFWMWLGTITNVFPMIYGAILVLFLGLSLGQAIIIILIGNVLSFPLLGLASLQGPATGTSTFAISRAPFGPRGNISVSVFNWWTMLGFETANLALVVLAGLALFAKAGVGGSTGLKIALILIACAIQLPLPLYGHATVLKSLKILSYLFIAATAVLAILVIPKIDSSSLSKGGAAWQALSGALALIIVGGGLSWANYGNDYSRYLPRNASKAGTFWWPTLGGLLPTVVMEILGAGVATITPKATDLISGLPGILPAWFLVPFLLIFIVQTFATNTVDLYTSGLSLQAMGVKIRRWLAVIIDLAITGALTFAVIFSGRFNQLLTDFLLLQLLWLAPWVSIYLVDWWLRRGVYSPSSLLAPSGQGIYWRNGGFHIPGMISLVVGILAAASWVNLSVYVGPLSSRTHGADFSVFMGIGVAGLLYFILARKSVQQEERAGIGEPDLLVGKVQGPSEAS
jgi:purine-cytosine permease-like protein